MMPPSQDLVPRHARRILPETQLTSLGTAVKLIFSILISYPLAGVLKRVPDARPAYKNLFSLRCAVPPRVDKETP
jgi:hypothetical protein